MQAGQKAKCELGSPEAWRDHDRLPGGAGLVEWAGLWEVEGRDLGGKKAQRQDHKCCFRGKSKELNLFKM